MRLVGKRVLGRAVEQYSLLQIEAGEQAVGDLNSAEQLLATFHDLLRPRRELRLSGALSEHISLEISCVLGQLCFYIWAPTRSIKIIEGKVRQLYPGSRLKEQTQDYSHRLRRPLVLSGELVLAQNQRLPTAGQSLQPSDALKAIVASISKIDHEDEEIWIQILIRPARGWKGRGSSSTARARRTKQIDGKGIIDKLNYAANFFSALAHSNSKSREKQVADGANRQILDSDAKTGRPAYSTKIRLVYCGQDERTARLRLQALAAAFRNISGQSFNSFKLDKLSLNRERQLEYYARFFIDKGFRLNSQELAGLFNLKYSSHSDRTYQATDSNRLAAPNHIATSDTDSDKSVSLFGLATVNGSKKVIGLKRADRTRHLYIVGEAETGKSSLLELLMLSDIYYDQGFALIDPHGDLAETVLKFIPRRRYDDVVYLNFSDVHHPISFNPLRNIYPSLISHLEVDLITAFKRLFGELWAPKTEYLLRHIILALLDFDDATLLDVPHLLKDESFRREVAAKINDPEVRDFWQHEFSDWARQNQEIVMMILNRVGDFLANPIIRNVVDSPSSTFSLRQIMDEQKIFIVNLDRKLLGEVNSSVLGELVMAKLRLGAAGRASQVDSAQTKPFYVYIDEFSTLATDSFSIALTETKRLNLNFTLADSSLLNLNPKTQHDILTQIGSLISFRLDETDVKLVDNYFQPRFKKTELLHLPSRSFAARLIVDGEKTPPFWAQLLNLPQAPDGNYQRVIERSRTLFANNLSLSRSRTKTVAQPVLIKRIFRLVSKGQARSNVGRLATDGAKRMADNEEKITKLH